MTAAKSFSGISLLICLLAGLLQANPAQAQPAEDLLAISSGGDSYARFGTDALPPLPADYFGPGSDPFEGQVALEGRHLLGNPYEYRIYWQNIPVLPHDPIGTSTTIPTEIGELWLASPQPVIVTYLGGTNPELWDMEMTLSVVSPPAGSQHSTKTHINGGTFTASLNVQPSFKFIRVSDGTEIDNDTGLASIPFLELEALGGHWVHDPDPMLGLAAPSAGVFVSCVEESAPGDPASQCPVPLTAVEASDALYLELVPAELLPPPDPFCTVPGDQPDGSCVVFGPSDNPPLPAGFFGPGSDPFEGGVCIEGEPLGPTEFGEYDNSSSLIKRDSDPFDRCEVPSPDLRPIDIEIVALSLRSIAPIQVTYDGGQSPEFWDFQMSRSSFGDSAGSMVVTKTHANGGTYEVDFAFHPRYVFTRVNDGHQVVFDVGLAGGNSLSFSAADGHWVNMASNGLMLAPSNGQFVPGVVEVLPGDPGSQQVVALHALESSGAGSLTLRPTLWAVSGFETPPARVAPLEIVPNPFNPVTRISFGLSQSGPVSLRIYDLQGRLVRVLVQADLPVGQKEIPWRALDDAGRRVASGVYLSVLKTPAGIQAAKMVVIK